MFVLAGLNITAAVAKDTETFFLNLTSGVPTGGFMFDVLNEVALRGRFNWQFILVSGYGNVAIKELAWLNQVLPRVDIVVNKPVRRGGRRGWVSKRVKSGAGEVQVLVLMMGMVMPLVLVLLLPSVGCREPV